MSKYVVGSKQTDELVSKAIRPGRLIAPAGQLVPRPPIHAVPAGASVSLCGTLCAQVFDDLDWDKGMWPTSDRCTTCRQRVAEAEAT